MSGSQQNTHSTSHMCDLLGDIWDVSTHGTYPGKARVVPPLLAGGGDETWPRSDLKGIGDLTSSFASARRSSTSEKLKLASVMNWLTTDTNLSPVC